MTFDPVLLSRIQFGFTGSFHIIFPTMSIGLAAFLALCEGMWLRTRDELWLRIYKFWVTIFAMGFGVWSSPASCCRSSSAPVSRSSPRWRGRCWGR